MIKRFLKSISIYGILPVVGKFLNFLLIPLYAKLFTPGEFGIIDLFDAYIFFLLIFASFEIPTALGRLYYVQPTIEYKKVIVSTCFYLSVLFSVCICLVAFSIRNVVLRLYIGNIGYSNLYILSLLWLFLMSINTFLSFVPRYDNKSTQYVLIGVVSIAIKLLSSVLFVAFFKQRIVGVFYGYICGNIVSIFLYAYIARNYLSVSFSLKYAREAILYIFPLVPGVVINGLWMPLLRNCISFFYPVSFIGFYAFANRLTSVNMIIYGALSTAWTPLLFEKKEFLSKGDDLRRISGAVLLVSSVLGLFITLFSPEFTIIIATNNYLYSTTLVAFLALAGIIKMISQLRGFGPYISDKTKYVTLSQLLSIVTSLLFFFCIKDRTGIYGIGVTVLVYEVINYLFLYTYTRRKFKIMLSYSWESLIVLYFIISGILLSYNINLQYRILCFVIFFVSILYLSKYIINYSSFSHLKK